MGFDLKSQSTTSHSIVSSLFSFIHSFRDECQFFIAFFFTLKKEKEKKID